MNAATRPAAIARRATSPVRVAVPATAAVASFEYRVALKPATSTPLTQGQAGLDVTLIALPGHTPIGPRAGRQRAHHRAVRPAARVTRPAPA